MTTTVTVTTHAWPVRVTTVDRFSRDQSSGDVQQHVVSETTTTETVPPNSSRDFYITSTRSLAFDELPAPPAPTPAPTPSDPPSDPATDTGTRVRPR